MSFMVCNIDIKKYNFEDFDMKCIKWLFILVFFIHANVFASDSILTWGEIINALGGQEAYLKLPIFNPDGIVRHIGRILPEMMEKPIMRGKYGPRKNDVFVAFKWVDTQDNKIYALVIYPSYEPYTYDIDGGDAEWSAYYMLPKDSDKLSLKEDVNERNVYLSYTDMPSFFGRCHASDTPERGGYQTEDTPKHIFNLEDFTKFVHGEVINYKCITSRENPEASTIKGAFRLFNEILDKDNYDPILIDVEKSFHQKIIGYVISEKEYNDLPFVPVVPPSITDRDCLINDNFHDLQTRWNNVREKLNCETSELKDIENQCQCSSEQLSQAVNKIKFPSAGWLVDTFFPPSLDDEVFLKLIWHELLIHRCYDCYKTMISIHTPRYDSIAKELAAINDCHVGDSLMRIPLEAMSTPVMRSTRYVNENDRLLALKLVDDSGIAHVIILCLDSSEYYWNWHGRGGGIYKSELQSPNIFFREAFEPNPTPDLDMHDLVILKKLYRGETVQCNGPYRYGADGYRTVHLEKISKPLE